MLPYVSQVGTLWLHEGREGTLESEPLSLLDGASHVGASFFLFSFRKMNSIIVGYLARKQLPAYFF